MQKVGRAHRKEANVFVELTLTEVPELFGHPEELLNVPRLKRAGIWRRS